MDRSKTAPWHDGWQQCAPTTAPWHDGWQQCAPTQWQHGGWQHADWGDRRACYLKDPDRKDVEPLERYSGDITGWLRWQKGFVRFLKRQNARWPSLIEKVEQLRGKNITTEQERQWEWELRLGDIGRWKEQLNQFLESYTKDNGRSIVDS